MKNALLLVDIQKDFLPGGTLAVPDGNAIILVVNELISKFGQSSCLDQPTEFLPTSFHF